MKPDKKYAVLIVSDHPVFLAGMSTLINREKGLIVCGSVRNLEKSFETIRELEPDLVIVDRSPRIGNGSEHAKKLRIHFEGLPIFELSMHDSPLDSVQSLLTGTQVYKQEAVTLAVRAIRIGLTDGSI